MSIRFSLFFPVLLVLVFPVVSIASEVLVMAHTTRVTPASVEGLGVCIRIEDTGGPAVTGYVGFPVIHSGEKLELLIFSVQSGGGESTFMEVLPRARSHFYEVAITAIRHGENFSGAKLEAVYGDSVSIPIILTLDLEDFALSPLGLKNGPVTEFDCDLVTGFDGERDR